MVGHGHSAAHRSDEEMHYPLSPVPGSYPCDFSLLPVSKKYIFTTESGITYL